MSVLLALLGLALASPTLSPEVQAFERALADRGDLQTLERAEAQGRALSEEARDPSDRSAVLYLLGEAWLEEALRAQPPSSAALARARAQHEANVAQAEAAGWVNIWVDLSASRLEEIDALVWKQVAQALHRDHFADALACEAELEAQGGHRLTPNADEAAQGPIELTADQARCLDVYDQAALEAARWSRRAARDGVKLGQDLELAVTQMGLDATLRDLALAANADADALEAELACAPDMMSARLQLRATELLHAHGHHEEASARFWRLYPPQTKEADLGPLEAFFFAEGDTWLLARRLGKCPLTPNPVLFDSMAGHRRLEAHTFQRAETLRREGRLREAALVLLHLSTAAPNTEGGASALLGAADSFDRAGDSAKATRCYSEFIQRYPMDERAPWIHYRVGSDAAAGLRFEEAISHFERLYERHPEDVNAPDALYQAGALRAGLGDHEGAAQAFERYALTYPAQADAVQVAWLAVLQWREVDAQRHTRAAQRFLKRYRDAPPEHTLQALQWIAEAAEAAEDPRLAERAWEALSRRAEAYLAQGVELSPAAQAAAAAPELRALVQAVEALEAATPDQDLTALQRQAAALDARGVDLIGRWPDSAEASLHLLARSDLALAAQLDARCGEACAAEQVALRERAVERLQGAVTLAQERQLRSPWTARSLSLLETQGVTPAPAPPTLGLTRDGLIPPTASDLTEAGARAMQRLNDSARAGQLEAATVEAQSLVTLAPSPPRHHALHNLAWAHLLAGDLDRAELLLHQALAAAETWDDPDLLASLGRLAQLQGEPAEARHLLERALQSNPDHLPALLWLAEHHAEHWGEDEAGRLLERALALEPEAEDIQAALAALEP